MFHEETSQDRLSLTIKNHYVTSSTNKISFTRTKINIQVSRRQNSMFNIFHREDVKI